MWLNEEIIIICIKESQLTLRCDDQNEQLAKEFKLINKVTLTVINS